MYLCLLTMKESDRQNYMEATAVDLFQQFEIEGNAHALPAENDPFAVLRSIIAAKIRLLIDKDPERLKYILYRIDVKEQKVKEALANEPLTEAAESIANLIINRQLEKVETRSKYGTGQGDLSWDIEP